MISEKLINILKLNTQFNDFVDDIENLEVLIKKLNRDDIKRLTTEYPALLKQKDVESILCITFIKNNSEAKNYDKLKKFKVYFDNLNEKTIKILKS